MPRLCTVCSHEAREAIDKALVAGTACRELAALYRVSPDAVERHAAHHLPATLTHARQQEDAAHALDVMTELRRCFARMNLLLDACHAWLLDPDDPGRYDLGPRADDVQVIYSEAGPDGKPVRKKARLSRLLAAVEEAGIDVQRGEWRTADPRDLIVKATAQLTTQVQLLAKLVGELDERPQVNVLVAPEWLAVRATLLAALAPYPDARVAVAGRLLALEGGDDAPGN